jgi:hypothetical protein
MDTPPSSDTLVFRDYPILMWLFGGIFVAMGAYIGISQNGIVPGLICILIGLGVGLPMATVSTITADRLRATLTVQRHTLFKKVIKEFPTREIESIEVESSLTYNRNYSKVYRIVVITKSGEKVPFKDVYSSGFAGKEKFAQKLRDYLGIAAPAQRAEPLSVREMLSGSFPWQVQQEGFTNGTAWRVEIAELGEGSIIRWVSETSQLVGQFLCLMQKPKGSASPFDSGVGVLGIMGSWVYQKVLELYGFEDADLPELKNAIPLGIPNVPLASQFTAISNSSGAATRGLLNPWVAAPLLAWVERHPLKQVIEPGRQSRQMGQLVVLFSPRALYVAFAANTTPELSQEIIDLGLELAHLVKS